MTKSKVNMKKVALCGLTVLCATFLCAALTACGSSAAKTVSVPDVTELTADDAAKALEGAGLVAKSGTMQYSDTVPEGRVASQSPSAGKSVNAGTTVEYSLSKGSQGATGSAPGGTVAAGGSTGASAGEATYASTGGSSSSSSSGGYGYTGMTHASASHYVKTNSTDEWSTYYASNAIDGTLTYCWAENANGTGIGANITLSSDNMQTISGMVINAGYQKSENVYWANSRPSRISVYAGDTYVGSYSLGDNGVNSAQTITFNSPVDTKSIKITIDDVYRGTYYTEVCISEIAFF